MKKLIIIAVSVAVAVIGLPVLLAAAVLGGGSGGCPTMFANMAEPAAATWDEEQLDNAAIIVDVGVTRGVPQWGRVIAVATAMQESGLRNLPDLGPGNDHDSIGLFQQRPSQGWGTPSQLADPRYQAGKFYDKLLTIPNWPQLPLAQAAQAVQVSAFPDAYTKWTDDALRIVTTVGSANWRTIPGDLEQCLVNCPGIVSNDGQSGSGSGCLRGEAVLARAATWLTAWGGGPVPYLSSADPTDWFRGYRRDCSGYASMALGLVGPGLDTAALAMRSTPIPKAGLRAGDMLINSAPNGAGHVVIFDHWGDGAMTSYVGYEQSGDGGTQHRVIPYPYFGGYPLSPFRYGPA